MATEDQDNVVPLPVEPSPPLDGLAPPPDDSALPVVVVDDVPPPPLGRSWAFDAGSETFTRSNGVPLETRGVSTLLGWIDKCVRTERGALPIHPPEYGMVDPTSIFGRSVDTLSAELLEQRFRDALTFHPHIADVTNFVLHKDSASSAAWVEFLVIRDPPSDDPQLLTIKTNLGGTG